MCLARDYDGLMSVVRDLARTRRLRHRQSLDNLMDEIAGIAGEIALARDFALDLGPIVSPEGVGPVDFVLPCGTEVDVKTSWWHDISHRKDGGRLLVKKGECKAHAYVFAIAHQGQEITCDLIGWQWSWLIKAGRATTEGRLGALSYRYPRDQLRAITDLQTHSASVVASNKERAAEMPSLVETQRSFDGREIVLRWWRDNSSVTVEIDGRPVGFAYRAERNGQRVWFDIFGGSNTPYPTAKKAATAVIERATNPFPPTTKKRAGHNSREMSAASGWRSRDGHT
jgi:hypothetical protein